MSANTGATSGMTPFLAIDWGTTNRRIYRIDATGNVEAMLRDDRGVAALTSDTFAGEMAAVRDEFGDLPALCAGMVGSTRGWIEAPYIACPANLNALSAGLTWAEPGRTAIVPGVICESGSRRDVMRGEEVQLLGAVQAGLVPSTALLCQPGTHSKWVWIRAGSVDRFTTAITGELFSILRRHSLLTPQLVGPVEPNNWFLAGVGEATEGDLLAKLFGVRADAVSATNRISDTSSYVSGLLIGSDVHARVKAGDTVVVLSDSPLGELYATAARVVGADASVVDSQAAFVAGICCIWSMIK